MRLASLAPLLLLVACGDDAGTPPDAEPVGDCGCVPADAPPPDAEPDAARIPDASTPDAPPSPDPDLTGPALVSVHPANLPDDLLVHFAAAYTMRAVPDGTARLDAVLQPLDFETFEPVGDPFVVLDLVVDAHDGFALDLVGTLPGRANPVTLTDIELAANLHATIRTDDLACGTIIGTAGPLPLEGSTFGSVRVPDDGPMPEPVDACPAP